MSANGPTTSEASIASMPSGPMRPFREDGAGVVDQDVEARFGREDVRVAARIDSSEPMSATTIGNRSSPWRSTSSSRTRARRSSLRPTSTTLAPSAATSSAACRPSPDVGPVMSDRPAVERPGAERRPVEQGAPRRDSRCAEKLPDDRDLEQIVDDVAWIHAEPPLPIDAPSDPSIGPPAREPMMDHMPWRHRMTTLRERIETPLPIDEAFAYVADFANSQEWDPGVATAERLDTGPVGVGSRYRLGVRMGGRVAPMEYRISVFEPPTRVVLTGVRVRRHRGRRHPLRAGSATGRASTTPPTSSWVASSGSSSRCSAARSRNLARNAVGGMQRTLDERAAAAEADRP